MRKGEIRQKSPERLTGPADASLMKGFAGTRLVPGGAVWAAAREAASSRPVRARAVATNNRFFIVPIAVKTSNGHQCHNIWRLTVWIQKT